jgi:hypothetical protein
VILMVVIGNNITRNYFRVTCLVCGSGFDDEGKITAVTNMFKIQLIKGPKI